MRRRRNTKLPVTVAASAGLWLTLRDLVICRLTFMLVEDAIPKSAIVSVHHTADEMSARRSPVPAQAFRIVGDPSSPWYRPLPCRWPTGVPTSVGANVHSSLNFARAEFSPPHRRARSSSNRSPICGVILIELLEHRFIASVSRISSRENHLPRLVRPGAFPLAPQADCRPRAALLSELRQESFFY
jgi:hypothetical protein